MIALHPFAELAACRLLLVLLIGIFAPRALKRKHNTCNTRRSTARSAPQPQVTAKLRCALFMGLLRTMEGAFLDKASLQGALAEWHNNQATAEATHGLMSTWDVSAVTDLSSLFDGKASFDEDINAWDVSKVTSMESMFRYTGTFNQPLSAWQVGQVTNFYGMFYSSALFNQDISVWNVTGATNMRYMFSGTTVLHDCYKLAVHTRFEAQVPIVWGFDWGDTVCVPWPSLPPAPPSPPPTLPPTPPTPPSLPPTPPSPPSPPTPPPSPPVTPTPRMAGEGAVGDDPIFVGSDGMPYEVRGEPGSVFNLLSAGTMSINAMFEAVPPKFQALDITDTVLGSVDLAACATDLSPLNDGGRGSLHFDVGSGNLSVSGAPIGAVFERFQCDLTSMSCGWVPATADHVSGGSVAGKGDGQARALVLPKVDSGFARVRVAGATGVATITRHCMLSLDIDLDCADFAKWPVASAACGALMRGEAPADVREEWVMLLTLPTIRAEERFCFMGLGLANVAAAPHEVHGLLGQRVAATEQPLRSASVSARGVPSVVFGPGFGPQGEGAIEGVYTDYRRDALHAHDTPSPHNRFLRCGVGSVEDAAPS